MAYDDEPTAPSKLPMFPAPLRPGGLYAPPDANAIAMRRYMAGPGLRARGAAEAPEQESQAASYPLPTDRFGTRTEPVMEPPVEATAATAPSTYGMNDRGAGYEAPKRASVANYPDLTKGIPDPGGGYEGRFSGYYGSGSTPQFPTAASMQNMVPQNVQDMIAAQTNRINFLRAGGAGWLGQLGAGHAQQRLLAMHELANRFMGTGVQAGHLGVSQGELGVKRGMLDIEHGRLGLGYGQLGADIWKNQPFVDRETLANQIGAPGGVPTGRTLDLVGQYRRAFGGQPRREITTVQGPWEVTSGDTNVVLPEGQVTKTPLQPSVMPGGAGDTKKPFGGAPVGPQYSYTYPDAYRPAVSYNVR